MKYLFCFLILGLFQKCLSQSNKNEEIFFDIISQNSYSENKGEIGYFKKVDSAQLNYNLKIFARDSSLVYYMYQRTTGLTDSIKLTLSEKDFLIKELKRSSGYEWMIKHNTDLKIVENKSPVSILNFLKEDRNREFKMISKPIYIRDNSIAFVFCVHLCCGQIFGHSSLSFYRLVNDKWIEWIVVLSGDY